MTSSRSQPAFGAPHQTVFTLCPNALMTLAILLSLLFVFQLKSLSALAFLAFGLTLALRRPQSLLVEIRDRLWIYSIPVWCLLTVLWSEHPSLSLRYSVQLGLTFLIAITIASRLSPQNFIKIAFVAWALAALASILIGRVRGDGMGWLGIYGSKNAFAATMSIFVFLSFALMLDRALPRFWRLAGMAATPVAIVLLMLAQGAGALISTLFALTVPLLLAFGGRFTLMQKTVMAGFLMLLGLLVAVTVAGFHDEIFALVLQTTGKDVTLTGRTDLWAGALEEITKNPLFGQGYQAVWVEGNPVAERYWKEFGIATKQGFHFHNNYLSNAVEIGIVGVVLQSAAFFGAIWTVLQWAIRRPGAANLFFIGFLVQTLMLSMVEVLFFGQFSSAAILILCALVYGLRAADDQLASDALRGRAFADSARRRSMVRPGANG